MQKLKDVSKSSFNNDEVTPQAEKIRHSMQSKQNEALEFTFRLGY